jgi:hypothetical protein
MSRPTFSLQPLEARRFLSVTPLHVEDCPEVVEAREDLQEVTMNLRHDRYAGRQALGAIRAEIVEELRRMHEENGEELREAVAPLRQELVAALKEQLVEVTKEKGQDITDARLAIEDKLAEFSPTLESLLAQLRTKAREVEAKLIAGHDKVMAAREELRVALEECQEEHGDEHAVA